VTHDLASIREPTAGEEREFEIADGLKMKFCWISAGEAQLGSPKVEQDYITKTYFGGKRPDLLDDETESKRKTFKTRGFWLGKYTVTQAEWKAVYGENPSEFDGTKDNKAKGLNTSRFPVERVSWDDCQIFLEKANKRNGIAKVFGKSGKFVLPNEDQWEYACRGGKGNKQAFHFGDTLNGTQANCAGIATYKTDKPGVFPQRTTIVGSYEKGWPHPWGLCDMHGNVWQWCENLYEQTNRRVIRGGCWSLAAQNCRSAVRFMHAPDQRNYGTGSIGFRVCFSLEK
jgi:formylglycine-generating enzyme required for sulfatase activity